MAITYATVAEMKTKNTALALTQSDAEILELVEAASRIVDYIAEEPLAFYGDAIPKLVKAATIFLACSIFRMQSSAGIASERIGDRNCVMELPSDVMRRAKMMIEPLNPPSLI